MVILWAMVQFQLAGKITASSVSQTMIDDLQELALKTGMAANQTKSDFHRKVLSEHVRLIELVFIETVMLSLKLVGPRRLEKIKFGLYNIKVMFIVLLFRMARSMLDVMGKPNVVWELSIRT